MEVKVIAVDEQNRVKLSRKAVLNEQAAAKEEDDDEGDEDYDDDDDE
jgi:polyribonucleotide nucleotidyltransferase